MTDYIGMFGLARRSGGIEIGEDRIKFALAEHKIKAVFVASDAAPNARKKAEQTAFLAKAPVFALPFTKAELGAAVGRGDVAAAAITDIEFAYGIAAKVAADDPERYSAALASLENKAKARRTALKAKAKPARGKAKRKENG